MRNSSNLAGGLLDQSSVLGYSSLSRQIELMGLRLHHAELYKDDGQTLFKTEELALARALRGESVHGLEMCHRPPDGGKLGGSSPLVAP